MSGHCNQLPEWLARELVARCERLFGEQRELVPQPDYAAEEVERLAAHGYDGSRLRRRYWKKVRER
jgi:predicted TIM-barrel fold metal-dependent hydrolase